MLTLKLNEIPRKMHFMQYKGNPHAIDVRKIAKTGIFELCAYVPGKPIQEVKEEYGLEEVIKLASNECPLPLPEKVIQSIHEETKNLSRYPDGHCRKLRSRLSNQLGIPPECILFGNGAEECVRLISQAFLNRSDTGLSPSPIYDAYDTAVKMAGADVVTISLKDYRIDLDTTLQHVDNRTKIVWLCSPVNPTGTIITRKAFESFLEQLPEGILVVFDEAYLEFVSSKEAAHALDYLFADARVIGLRTFSKAFGLAGLRIGYIVAHPSVTEVISMVKLPFNVNALAQVAALMSLDETEFVKNYVRINAKERGFLHEKLEKRGMFVVPSEANFLFVEIPIDSDDLFRRLMPRGIIVRPGSIWGLDRFIRLTIGTREQNLKFLSALDQVLAETKMTAVLDKGK